MTTSYQAAIIDDLEGIAAMHRMILMHNQSFSNEGVAYVGRGPDDIRFEFGYSFQNQSVTIRFNNSSPGPSNNDHYYFKPGDVETYRRVRERFEELCTA